MRQIPSTLQEKLQAGVTQLCWCWKISRKDGISFGFTDHDRDLQFDNLLWKSSDGVSPGVAESISGFETGSAGSSGILLNEHLEQADLEAGFFDGAAVEIWRVDWTTPMDRFGVWAGELGEIRIEDHQFQAELVSNTRKLDRSIGRVFSKQCSAELGDAKCGVDLLQGQRQIQTSIHSVLDVNSFAVAGLVLPESDYFKNGFIQWTEAGHAGQRARITGHSSVGELEVFTVLESPKIPPLAADAIELTAGCNKGLTHCKDKFDNIQQFRGCPFMPGNDVLLSIPYQ